MTSDFCLLVALSRIQLSICSLFEGRWWMNDISSSFASTTAAATPSAVCSSSSNLQLFYAFPAINILPFWIRFFQVFQLFLANLFYLFGTFHTFLQCMRKWWDAPHGSGWKKTGHLVNAGKYVSCIILVVADTLQKVNPRPFVFPLVPIQGFWLAAAIVKTLSVISPLICYPSDCFGESPLFCFFVVLTFAYSGTARGGI